MLFAAPAVVLSVVIVRVSAITSAFSPTLTLVRSVTADSSAPLPLRQSVFESRIGGEDVAVAPIRTSQLDHCLPTSSSSILSSLYSGSVRSIRFLLKVTGLLPTFTSQFTTKLAAAESDEHAKVMADVTPGNYNDSSPSFETYCFISDGDVWTPVAIEPALYNKGAGFQEIFFMSRAMSGVKKANISAWYLPSNKSSTWPTIIFVPGSAQRSTNDNSIVPGSWARMIGFNSLIIDLRNHGNSERTNKKRSWGSPEVSDVLGAVDCIKAGCGGTTAMPLSKIGIHGLSAGGYVTYQVFGAEQALPAVWVDSGVYDLQTYGSFGVKQTFTWMPLWVAKFAGDIFYEPVLEVMSGYGYDDSYTPANIIGDASPSSPRRFFLTTMTVDGVVPATQQEQAAKALTCKGYQVEEWIVESPKKEDVIKWGCRAMDPKLWNSHVDQWAMLPEEYKKKMSSYWMRVFNMTE